MDDEGSTPESERLEQAMLRALHEAAPPRTREGLDLRLHRIGDALVSIAGGDPSIMLNRTLGLGLEVPMDERAIDDVCEVYRAAGVQRFFLHVHPNVLSPTVRGWLERAGLRPHRRWMKFERGAHPPPEATTTLEVREIGEEDAADFGRIAAAGFDLSPRAAPLFSGLVGRPGFHLYMSFEGTTPVGTGLLYIEGEGAWLDFGATDPAFRGHGSQRATLARRIAHAVEVGCTRLMTCTGEAVPGDPQHSYHNIEWAGFRPSYLRDNWVPSA